jgi:hypothetical protein
MTRVRSDGGGAGWGVGSGPLLEVGVSDAISPHVFIRQHQPAADAMAQDGALCRKQKKIGQSD